MRILIVGGGVAGLTLAAKLRQQGRQPVVIEKADEYRDIGYAIGLYPLGNCVLHGLGVYDDFLARGVLSKLHEIADHVGQTLQAVDVAELIDNVGPVVMLTRTDLIDVLRKACGDLPVRMGTTIDSLEQTGDVVQVAFNDGAAEEFDLVVGCDGIHSQLRRQVFGPCEEFDTGWSFWTWWARRDLVPNELIREYWGRGWMFGAYPVPDKCMCCIGMPKEQAGDPHAAAETVRALLEQTVAELAERVEAVRFALADAERFFAWPMTDIRAADWVKGRVALCGDSGTAFLPTAGVGASNAMRAAAALADELSRADAQLVPLALDLYEQRCQKLVRGNQQDSRNVGRMMFVNSKPVSWGRDQLIKHYPAGRFLQEIIDSMHKPF